MSGMQLCGRDWKRLQEAVPGKTMPQVKSYYQNYKAKVQHCYLSMLCRCPRQLCDLGLVHGPGFHGIKTMAAL